MAAALVLQYRYVPLVDWQVVAGGGTRAWPLLPPMRSVLWCLTVEDVILVSIQTVVEVQVQPGCGVAFACQALGRKTSGSQGRKGARQVRPEVSLH